MEICLIWKRVKKLYINAQAQTFRGNWENSLGRNCTDRYIQKMFSNDGTIWVMVCKMAENRYVPICIIISIHYYDLPFLENFKPGVYALCVFGKLPQAVIEELGGNYRNFDTSKELGSWFSLYNFFSRRVCLTTCFFANRPKASPGALIIYNYMGLSPINKLDPKSFKIFLSV